jgi:hypothetical protein
MPTRKATLLFFAVNSIYASTITWSVTATSYYPIPDDPVQADAYVNEAFPIELDAPATLTFSATYAQSPHTCIGDGCVQDLNTFSYTEPGLYFDSDPDEGICNKITGASFPCSATLHAGTYDLVLEINDVLDTSDFIGNAALPFTDTLTVTVDGIDAIAAPEPSSRLALLLGLVLLGIVASVRSKQGTVVNESHYVAADHGRHSDKDH